MLTRKQLQFVFVVLALSAMILAGTAFAKQGPDKVVIWTTNPSETVADG